MKQKILVYSEPGCDIFAWDAESKELILADLKKIHDAGLFCTSDRVAKLGLMTTQGPSMTEFTAQGQEYSVAAIYAFGGQVIGECVYTEAYD